MTVHSIDDLVRFRENQAGRYEYEYARKAYRREGRKSTTLDKDKTCRPRPHRRLIRAIKFSLNPFEPDRSTRMLKEGCSRSGPTTARHTARNSGGSWNERNHSLGKGLWKIGAALS